MVDEVGCRRRRDFACSQDWPLDAQAGEVRNARVSCAGVLGVGGCTGLEEYVQELADGSLAGDGVRQCEMFGAVATAILALDDVARFSQFPDVPKALRSSDLERGGDVAQTHARGRGRCRLGHGRGGSGSSTHGQTIAPKFWNLPAQQNIREITC